MNRKATPQRHRRSPHTQRGTSRRRGRAGTDESILVRDEALPSALSEASLGHAVVERDFHEHFVSYAESSTTLPLLMLGDAVSVLRHLPGESINCCMTSPPYWGKRSYVSGGLGLETDYHDYISKLLVVFREVKRVLKPTGSFWLNIGDSYHQKRLLGIPWRVALALTDDDGWILRDSVVWNKVKGGPDNATDRLRNIHEPLYHFVKIPSGYYFDADAVRADPRKARVVNGAIVSASGVTGIRYKRQIELSTALSPEEKRRAQEELSKMLEALHRGATGDFRMIIRGQQRTTHSDSPRVSGRARELQEKGFYFLCYHPKGSKPADVWDILPEDTQGREGHFAAYPLDLCRIPIKATCPPGGLVLDPFCGTGTTMLAARNLERKSLGIDIARDYLQTAAGRCASLL